MITDLVRAEWFIGGQVLSGQVEFGRWNGHRLRMGITARIDQIDLGVKAWWVLPQFVDCAVGLGFVSVWGKYMEPFSSVLEPPMTAEERAIEIRRAQIIGDMEDDLEELPIPALEEIAARVKAEGGANEAAPL